MLQTFNTNNLWTHLLSALTKGKKVAVNQLYICFDLLWCKIWPSPRISRVLFITHLLYSWSKYCRDFCNNDYIIGLIIFNLLLNDWGSISLWFNLLNNVWNWIYPFCILKVNLVRFPQVWMASKAVLIICLDCLPSFFATQDGTRAKHNGEAALFTTEPVSQKLP